MEKIIQITAGRGPAECTWVAAQVLKKILDEAQTCQIEATVLQREAGNENGTVLTALILLKGKTVAEFVNSWKGTIQWIGQSSFRKMHKRKNWFIGIFEMDALAIKSISEKDIQYQAMRSSGAGGQHVNKVSSAIRATHVPTGLSTVAMDSRSQHQNKKLATERLLEKFKVFELEMIRKQASDQWENQLNVARGNPTRTFTGSDFKNEKTVKSYKSERQKLKQQLNHRTEYIDS
ncbi:peptide chain release factor H [Flavobacterium sp. HJJ]|uniref:peptide chain release factor H n=1 Tax=Flavobacterium sp. HJJ TaxID=2783792 RepID=UPI00188BF7D4|nr:peptide chain release factor H [Flavobacterium sp. HJJ]MBF4470731.1 peptide chain release factor H [Flavobacterium sp. HJJ]